MLRQTLLPLSVVVILLQIHTSLAQLRNRTLFKQLVDNLDDFEPDLSRPNTTRIVGGKPIKISRVPWQVAIFNLNSFICGGSVISVDWILTAAHCVADGGSFSVRAGSSYWEEGGQIRVVSVAVFNSNYDKRTFNRDIAMLRVDTEFLIDSNVRPIALAREKRGLPKTYFISGWGIVREGGNRLRYLRGVTVRSVSHSSCRNIYYLFGISITKSMICAASPGKDSCHGDSGGPLVRRGIQYGIVSFGFGCARRLFPGVYTNTRSLNAWIEKVVMDYGGSMPTFE